METVRPEIRRGRDAREHESAERCRITESANDSGDEPVPIARARVRPNTSTAWHRLAGITERHVVFPGRGRFEIGDLEPVGRRRRRRRSHPARDASAITTAGQ